MMPQQVTSLKKLSSSNAAQAIEKTDLPTLLQLAKQSLWPESHDETLHISSQALLPMPTYVAMTLTTFLMHTQKQATAYCAEFVTRFPALTTQKFWRFLAAQRRTSTRTQTFSEVSQLSVHVV
jgi:hypothetical protein